MNAKVAIDEQLRLLAATPMLSGVHQDSLIRMAQAGRFVTVPKGEYLFQQHDPADALYILRSGELAIIGVNVFDTPDDAAAFAACLLYTSPSPRD